MEAAGIGRRRRRCGSRCSRAARFWRLLTNQRVAKRSFSFLASSSGLAWFYNGHVWGGRSFIEGLPMENFRHLEAWTAQTWFFVVEAALTCWDAGERAFTDAYNPSRCYHSEEARARRAGRTVAQAAYDRRCGDLIDLWLQREALAAVLIPMTTWRVAVRRVSEVRSFGGTGFAAKELALDVACGYALSQAADFNSWCPVGPGARRAAHLGQERIVRICCKPRERRAQQICFC